MRINEIPIVLHSMDSYSKFWNPWYFLFNLHCKNHGPIFFLSEEKEPDFVSEVTHIKTGKGEWGQRLLDGLSKIDSDILFYMQEDFWCTDDLTLTDDIIKMFDEYQMDQFHIVPIYNTNDAIHIKENVYRLKQNAMYTQNHQFGLWKKHKLIDNVLPHENPWRNEIDGTKRLNETPHNVYVMEHKWYWNASRKGNLSDCGEELIRKHKLIF